MGTIFYQPSDAICADFIPFYEDGVFYLFYLKDYRNPAVHGEGTPWFLVTTSDFVHFTDRGEVLPRGTRADQDLYVFTGSVIKHSGQYHIYYTGHNPHFRAAGKPEQAVMHAVSDDLIHWTKRPEDTFFAPEAGYEMHDWRDPFVFYHPEKQHYEMLLAARAVQGPSRRRGMTALCASPDGIRWQVEKPLWNPGLYFTHECPDLFQMGDWYYLIYSEFSQDSVTRYRMSRSLEGPWIIPPDDRFDGRAYYAAKSCAGEAGRYLFGWIPTREKESASGNWQWGGCLCVHELIQRPDGTLSTRMPEQLANRFAQPQSLEPLTLSAPSGYACTSAGQTPESCMLSATLTPTPDTGEFGLVLRSDPELETGYQLRLCPGKGTVVIDRWPRPGDQPYEAGLCRPLPPADAAGSYTLQIILDGSAATAYIQGEKALSFRLYEIQDTHWGPFVQDGSLTCTSQLS